MKNVFNIHSKGDLIRIIKSQNEIIELQKHDLDCLKSEILFLNKQIKLLQNEREKW